MERITERVQLWTQDVDNGTGPNMKLLRPESGRNVLPAGGATTARVVITVNRVKGR